MEGVELSNQPIAIDLEWKVQSKDCIAFLKIERVYLGSWILGFYIFIFRGEIEKTYGT